ncbi:MAG TPA: CoA transferase [Thermoanaerobaculia bacterium]|nr:CoA transferase [Thermoanaerobaculia bacterium]
MLLKPYRVLDLTGPLGFAAGKVFADLGADVVKIEPPGGDAARTEQNLYWVAANAGKRSITLDLQSESGRQTLRALAAKADFLLESFPPGTLESWSVGYEVLRAENPGLIMVSITPFGQDGPYADFEASDLEIMALSGAMSLAGKEGGEPMRVSLPQSPYWVGVESVMGALTALANRASTGHGQRVDVSAQVAVLSALAHAPVFWDLNRVNPERAGIYITGRSVTGAKMTALWRCNDGWINFIIYGGAAGRHTNQQLVKWMAEKEMAPGWLQEIDWSDFAVTSLTQEQVDRLEAPIGNFFTTLTKREFLDGALQREMLGYPVSTVEDIFADRQLEARSFWSEVVDATSGRKMKSPGGFAIINGERLAAGTRAPRIGEHNHEVLQEGK